jgi:diaminohydroxyphosphoribosylaminopyrimidine deaminase/5-amino-6-(5-phosphoribosylamino)uracil reductase
VEVVVAPEMSEIVLQLRRFEVPRREGRPYVVLKWAQSSDGFVDAREAGEAEAGSGGTPISAPRSRLLSHTWRTWEDGILVGGRTALVDVPQLDARAAAGRSPRPVVLGRPLPADHPLATRALLLDPDTPLPAALAGLTAEHGLSSLLVEGGPTTHGKFLAAGVWDEIRILESPRTLGRGLPAPTVPVEAIPVGPPQHFGEDRVLQYFHPRIARTEPAA